MRTAMIAVLVTVILAAIVSPFIEIANMFRERILVSSAARISLRAAANDVSISDSVRDLEGRVDRARLCERLAENLELTLNLSLVNTAADSSEIVLRGTDSKFDDVTVKLDYEEHDNSQTITMEVSSPYKFKIPIMARAVALRADRDPYKIVSNTYYTIRIIN